MRRLLTLLAPTRRSPLACALIAGAIVAALAAFSGLPGEIDSLHFILAVIAISTLLVAAALAERHKAERRAKAAETRLRDAIESIGAGFALFDRDDRLVISNETHKRMYPKNRALMVPGTRFEDILRGSVDLGQHPDASGRAEEWIAARMRRHLNPGEPFEQDRGNGHWLLIGEQRTSEGGIVGTWTDISQQKRQELQLRQSEDRLARALQTLQALIEICPLAIIEVDRAMTVSSWNPAAQSIFGWSRKPRRWASHCRSCRMNNLTASGARSCRNSIPARSSRWKPNAAARTGGRSMPRSGSPRAATMRARSAAMSPSSPTSPRASAWRASCGTATACRLSAS